MASTSPNLAAQEAPTRFVSLSSLLAPGGLFAVTFDPTPSRRSLIRRFRRAGITRWKCNGAYGDGRGEPYFERSAVEAWVRGNFSPSVPQATTAPTSPGASEPLNPSTS